MEFEPKPIGIGKLTNLRRVAESSESAEKPAESKSSFFGLKKVPTEPQGHGEAEPAQLSVDVYETAETLFIVAPLAGVATEDVRVEITDDVVLIEGNREHPLPELGDRDLLVQECYFGPFARSIVLPEAVDSRQAKAQFKKNILVISIPKLDSARTRVIRIDPV